MQHAELGLLDADKAGPDRRSRRSRRARRARRPVSDRRLPDRFRHLVEHERQRGDRGPRGTGRMHPNDDVNFGQSSNDVFLDRGAPRRARGARLRATVLRSPSSARRSRRRPTGVLGRHRRQGGTHALDGCRSGHPRPARFGGYAAQVREGRARVEATLGRASRGKIPLGGTAVGSGPQHPALDFARRGPRGNAEQETELSRCARGRRSPRGAGSARRPGRGLGRARSGCVAVSLTKIANDLRYSLASWVRAPASPRFSCPSCRRGSSIMPGPR